MSWELVERLRERFPEIEPFPREAGDAESPGEPAAPAGRPARHEPKAYAYHVPGAFVPADRLLAVCRVLRDDAPFLLDYCSFVSAVDRPDQGIIEVVYHLFSMAERHEMLVKVRVPREAPLAPSVADIWRGANWHERETYDLFGIVFEGHPDLRRIMLTEDWVGHPLRKDYVYEEPRWLVDLAAQRQKEIEGLGLGERA
ncbi:MAG: NADH-quinone oxidoreductase subunit C [Armatimonadota bacterium]|nr:NADH-quinone oxidoreductase subunit C [Armatimonadota bacterium]MDR7549809.1 NADH-quinone oxidoreductase subunit C [Armatimonadota bacterium]